MLKLAISGAEGRMGSRILALALQDRGFKIAAAFERPSHPALGRDAGEACGLGKIGTPLKAPSLEEIRKSDVLVEFTTPQATLADLALAIKAKRPIVIGTTGLSDSQLKKIKAASRLIPILLSPNMSVGVSILFDLVHEAASRLGDYDVEIIEAHHNLKKDAPSGTAKRLAEIVAKAKNENLSRAAVHGRFGQIGARPRGEIGIHAVRAGDIVGDHTVLFSSAGERLELTHRAHSRDAFAKGALAACKYIAGKKPGLYTMRDALKG